MRTAHNLFFYAILLFSSNCVAGQPKTQDLKVSQFERAGYCDFLIDKSTIYHALFQESPDNGKPIDK